MIPAVLFFLSVWPVASPQAAVTFNRDIAPIIYKNCATCHRPGEVAPFSLLSYSDVAKRAALIASVTAKRYMPPWKPEPGFGEFADQRRLTEKEIALIDEWATNGAAEGDPNEKPTPPQFQDGWQLGQPDLIVKVAEPYTVPAEGRDIYRCFVIPLNFSEERYVSAIEFRPGNRRVVHHAILHTEEPGPARERDAANPGSGYNCFGGGGGIAGEGGLGGWVPGVTPRMLPDGLARSIPARSDLIIQNHYHPDGKPEIDQSTVGIYFAKTPPTQTLLTLPLVQRNLTIPPGDARYKVEASFTTPIDIRIIGISPHMHLLGREIKVTASLPDGSERPMIWIKDWDFNWQGQYLYREPLVLPAGTRIQMDAYYDNSSDNPRNPNDPPRMVRWGEQTTDEMALSFIPIALSNATDRRRLLVAFATQLRSTVSPRGIIPQGLRGFLSTPLGLELLFARMSGGNDAVTRDQFRKFIAEFPQTPAALFDLLDANENGVMTREEFELLGDLLQGQ